MTRTAVVTRIREQIDLPAPVATWVLTAHLFTLASPFVLLWAADVHAGALDGLLARPFLLDVAAGLFLVGSAFEIAQNTADRWYYEGPYPAFSDLLFNGSITVGLGVFALAATDAGWVVAVVVVMVAIFPWLYLTDRAPFAPTAVLGVVAVGALASALGEPLVLLMLVFTPGLNLYFLALVERTRAQSFHGAIASSSGLGIVVVAIAVDRAVAGAEPAWAVTAAVAAGVLAAAALAWRPLSRLGATVRHAGQVVPEPARVAS